MTPLLAQRPRSDRAFERIYKRHVADVYRYALAVMRNPADAEDVTQTTFLNAYRAYVEKGSRPEKPQNWLIAIAHNVCRQRFRQSARRPAEVSFEDEIADTIADDDVPSGDDIRRALGHLAFNQRAALVMRELEGRSYAEIADILEVSTSAVETLIFRARRALREQLEGSLTCGEAEFAISRQLDGRLVRQERRQLRAHLRECAECGGFARRQRAQRGALRTLAFVPVPSSVTSLFGGGGAAAGTGLTLKAAAAVTVGLAIGGSYEGLRHAPSAVACTKAACSSAAKSPAVPWNVVLAPRGQSAVASEGTRVKHRDAAKVANAKTKKAKKIKTNARGDTPPELSAQPQRPTPQDRGAVAHSERGPASQVAPGKQAAPDSHSASNSQNGPNGQSGSNSQSGPNGQGAAASQGGTCSCVHEGEARPEASQRAGPVQGESSAGHDEQK